MNALLTTIEAGKLVCSTDNRRSATVLSPAEAEANGLLVPAGMVAINLRSNVCDPFFMFASITGRTRRTWGMDCPTVNLFDCDTVARRIESVDGQDSFALWGVPGARRTDIGTPTWVTRPENLV